MSQTSKWQFGNSKRTLMAIDLRAQHARIAEAADRIQALKEENCRIRETLGKRAALLPQLDALALAAAQCIDAVGKDGQDIDDALLATLARLGNASPLCEPEKSDPVETDVLGRMFHKMLSMVVNMKRLPIETLSVVDLCKLEEDVNEWLRQVENDGILPRVREDESWKAQFANREPRV